MTNKNPNDINYNKIYEDFKLNDQRWYAKLKNGKTLDCGYGLVEGEFIGDSWNEIAKVVPEEMDYVEGYYIFDGTSDFLNESGNLNDIDYEMHPDDDVFVLVPKEDIIDTYFMLEVSDSSIPF